MSPLDELMIDNNNNRIFIKRDDLVPFSFGGNKVRIAQELINDMRVHKKNCIIGYGNSRSNLSRALSNLCYSQGIRCHIISPADEDGTRVDTYNSILVKKSNVIIHECLKNNVSQTVEKVLSQCKDDGYDPYYIYGSIYGKGNEAIPVNAYVKVYNELLTQFSVLNVEFDYIFLACGTGMTQAGLIAGKRMNKGKEKIIGISVARPEEQEVNVIKSFLDSYRKYYYFDYSIGDIIIDDSWLCSGYGKYDERITNTIDTMYKQYGIPLDPTYTGKAFHGMLEHLSINGIKGKKVLFIHTGGTPLFFDYLKNKIHNNYPVTRSYNLEKLVSFLRNVDKQLPVPLSKRVEISKYAEKILEFGNVLTIEIDNIIAAAVMFYTNDKEKHKGYITLISCLKSFENNGYGGLLLKSAEDEARKNGMKYMTLETDLINYKAIAFYSKRKYRIDFVDSKVHMIKEL